MKWTKTKPDRPGWWWRGWKCDAGDVHPQSVESIIISADGRRWIIPSGCTTTGYEAGVEIDDCWWWSSSPIPEPEGGDEA